MRIIDFYPTRGYFRPGEIVTLVIDIETDKPQPVILCCSIQHLGDEPNTIERSLQLEGGEQQVEISWQPSVNPAGYGAQASLLLPDGQLQDRASTAFDILDTWTDFPRYGFLCDFHPGRVDGGRTIRQLSKYHINGLQFYDWQYRHDQLLAPSEIYSDPLGRELSLVEVRSLVQATHQYGMSAMPYLAIYAASVAFWRTHPDWALYDGAGQSIPFGQDFLGLMDPTPGRPWLDHLFDSCARSLEAISFDGLHIDQYGDPKQAWDAKGYPVDLPGAFIGAVHKAKERFPGKTVVFNAVGNWPIEALARTPADFEYVEVWPPDISYRDLARIVLEAGRLSGGKPVVIALYLPANWPANILLANALIAACGGTRIELGEAERLLADPYFPKHQEISGELRKHLRQYADFIVRFGEWFRPATFTPGSASNLPEFDQDSIIVSTAPQTFPVLKRGESSYAVSLINFTGLDENPTWDVLQPWPTKCRSIQLRVRIPWRPRQVLWACPERPGESPQSIPFEYENGWVRLALPELSIWGVVNFDE